MDVNIVGKFTILHKAVVWAVVRGNVFILEYIFYFILEYIFYFISIVELLFVYVCSKTSGIFKWCQQPYVKSVFWTST
jgi:hypothetical protein